MTEITDAVYRAGLEEASRLLDPHLTDGGRAAGPARPLPDPAPDPIDVARQRAVDFVHNIATNTLLDLRRRRDEIDNTIEQITRTEAALAGFIGEFAQRNHDGLLASADIKKAIEYIAKPFAKDPPSTITQEDTK